MTREELLNACPSLGETLAAEPALSATLDALIQCDLADSLVRYLDDGSREAIRTFLREAGQLDMQRVLRHRRALRAGARDPLGVGDVDPVRLVTLEEQRPRLARDEARGLEALGTGSWACLAFAGGSGTRFFSRIDELSRAVDQPNEVLRSRRFDPAAPKGAFPISPVRGLSFYDNIIAEALHAGVTLGRLPWVLLLTSAVTHDQTLRYLSQAELWGFPRDGWLAFRQADEPRLDVEGHLLVQDDEGHLTWTGDGHGGVYRALLASQPDGPCALERIRSDGVEHLVMHNVDNAAARPFAPARLGFHLRENALFTLSATRRVDPREQVGVLMRIRRTGKVEAVEYNVIDPAIAGLRDVQTGRLVHEAGNINTNLVAAEAIRADIDPTLYTGKVVASRRGPVEGSSLEMLNQHLTRLLDPERIRAYEVDRDEFFMPTKNATGADSVSTTVHMMSRRFANLLAAAGADVSPDALCDLHPACGVSAADLRKIGIGPGWTLGPRSRLYLCAHHGWGKDGQVGSPGLVLEEGSSLVIDCDLPYGEVYLEPHRELHIEPERASRVRLGQGMRVRAGVHVAIRIGRGARLQVVDGRVFSQDFTLEVRPDEMQRI